MATPTKHARWSPSSTDANLECPSRLYLLDRMNIGGGEHNEFTARGTVIHAIGEMVLRAVYMERTDWRPIFDHALGMHWGYYADVGSFSHEIVDDAMMDQVQVYLDCSRELVDEGDKVYLEKELYYSADLFGTADMVVDKGTHLIICDLKTGSGNMVSAWENRQLMTYAAMAKLPEHDVIELVIVQPPAEEPMNKYLTTGARIDEHLTAVLEALGKSCSPDHLSAGDHCRWCQARAACPELHRMVTNAMNTDLDGLTPEKWAEVLGWAQVLKPWCESVYQRANQLANENGLHIPGYKLVDKKGRKTWTSELAAGDAITRALDDAGVELEETPDIFVPSKLRTPLQVTKALKGVVEASFIEELTTVPLRGTILVPDSDKRPETETGDNLLLAAEQIAYFK